MSIQPFVIGRHITTGEAPEDDEPVEYSDNWEHSPHQAELREQILYAANDLRPDVMSFWRAVRSESTAACNDIACSLPSPARRQPHLRGAVLLSPQPGAHKTNTMPSVCCVDRTHIILLGGHDWEKQLVKINLSHLTVTADGDHPCSFRIQIGADAAFGQDTRVVLSVCDQMARDKWLSALWERRVAIEGWDASLYYRPPRRATGNFVPLVTWLS